MCHHHVRRCFERHSSGQFPGNAIDQAAACHGVAMLSSRINASHTNLAINSISLCKQQASWPRSSGWQHGPSNQRVHCKRKEAGS